MSDRLRAALLSLLLLAPVAAAAEPAVTLLDLPFRATAMRGPRSEVAVAVATSGLLPLARPRADGRGPDAGEEESAPVVVVWGPEGGAALHLVDGAVRTTLLGAEAVEGLAAAETPRGALPGSRRALAGPLSAYLTGSTRAAGGVPAAAGLTIRERQPVAMGGDPKPVPISTVTVPAGAAAVFAPLRPRVFRLSGRPAFVAATLHGADRSGLALVARRPDAAPGDWSVVARTPPQDGGPTKVVAIAAFDGARAPRIAAVKGAGPGGTLQLWRPADDALTLSGEAAGYAAGAGDADLAAPIEAEGDGVPELALPTTDGASLAWVSLQGGIRELGRAALPAPAAFGVAALGQGAGARLFVGLADGRVAVVGPRVRP